MNMRGCNNAGKKRRIVRMMGKNIFNMLRMNETKMNRMCKVRGHKSGERAKGGVAVLFKEDWWKGVLEQEEISERLMY